MEEVPEGNLLEDNPAAGSILEEEAADSNLDWPSLLGTLQRQREM